MDHQLKRSLKVRDLVLFGLAFMSPVAAMTIFGIVTLVAEGHSVLAYVIGFIAMLFTAISFGKMVEVYPSSGSTYTYVKNTFHEKLGFMAGWGMLLDYILLPVLMFSLSATYTHALIPNIPIWAWVLIYAIPITTINVLGIDMAAKLNMVLVVVMLSAVILFIVVAVNYLMTGGFTIIDFKAIYNPDTFKFNAIIGGAAISTLAYLGFDAITTLTEETNENVTSKKISFAIIIALAIQTLLFISVTYFAMVILKDYTLIGNPDTAFIEVLQIISGPAVQIFITLTLIISGVAAGLASQSVASRLLFNIGRDNGLPKAFFAYLHPKYKTPAKNVVLVGVIAIAGAVMFSMTYIADFVAFGGLLGFMFVNLAVIYHYFIKTKQRNIIANLLLPLIGFSVCLYLILGLSIRSQIFGLCWLLVGGTVMILTSAVKNNTLLIEETSDELHVHTAKQTLH